MRNPDEPISWLATSQLFFCIFILSVVIYEEIDSINNLTELRLAIPALTEQIKEIREENQRILYEIEQFESPLHLIELARKPEFGHLHYPYVSEVFVIERQ